MPVVSENSKSLAKAVIIFVMIAFHCYICKSQVLTDTMPHNKNAVIEEFTAVHCYYCPAGHRLLDSIIQEYPGRIIPIAMHPANAFSNYTTPYPGSQDFRRSYLNAFFTMPFVHDSIRFFPGAFINRRQWRPNKREQFTDKWRQNSITILNEQSKVNVGLSAIYDVLSSMLSVDVEIYFTDSINNLTTLYVFLTEDSLVAEQNNGGTYYIHNHVFRDAFTQQWGDTIAVEANKKTLVLKHYNFNNSSNAYEIIRCHISAIVRNAVSGEIITGEIISCDNIILAAGKKQEKETGFTVFPNPSNQFLEIKISDILEPGEDYYAEISDLIGVSLITSGIINRDGKITLNISSLNVGTYIIGIKNKDKILWSKKIVKL